MEAFSTLLVFCAQRPVTRSFDVYFGPHLNQQFNKQWRRRWFETDLKVMLGVVHNEATTGLLHWILRQVHLNAMATVY